MLFLALASEKNGAEGCGVGALHSHDGIRLRGPREGENPSGAAVERRGAAARGGIRGSSPRINVKQSEVARSAATNKRRRRRRRRKRREREFQCAGGSRNSVYGHAYEEGGSG